VTDEATTSTAPTRPGGFTDEQLGEFMRLVEGADSVELKLTIPESAQRSAASSLDLDPLDGQIRQVFFFDTPSLDLERKGVVVRARRIQKKASDTVVKLRPVVPAELPADLRRSPGFVVEVDAMPGSFVCSGSLKGETQAADVKEVITGGRPLRKLLTKEQRTFFKAHAPEGTSLDDLRVLGPIFVLKLKFSPKTLGRRLVAELWLYPDGSRVLELSTKCATNEAFQVAAETRVFLTSRGITLGGEQQTKTRKALEFFSQELEGG
jgi:hypothetical protein